ncbi:thermonuclease family protein [Caldalkalibacillus thermarum TA2.A1]|uniref:Thermonuclease family protein n=1 Tax=Caldalkalibacillus thermarum (strain TA2.A1) TaxID=986075 RepID=A0A8X8L9D5_CALTT|nr:thermonuclease family protein [Caldalkalibacillus thermarum TA2.A1]
MAKKLLVLTLLALSVLAGCADNSVTALDENEIIQSEAIQEEAHIQNQVDNNEANTQTSEEKTEETSDVPVNTIPAFVTRVVDGDTFVAEINGQEERIRLILVDAPESIHPSKPVEPFGPEASEFAKEMLEGKEVHLELDVSERDRYGRVLAYVWIGDRMFNEMLLEKGLARVAVFPPNVKYVDRFRQIEKEAQRKGIGIWSIEDYASQETSSATNNTASKTSSNCDEPKIKGNINSKGEKIYHVPGGQFYDVTIPEEMFCTEEEAQAAGYRKSKR